MFHTSLNAGEMSSNSRLRRGRGVSASFTALVSVSMDRPNGCEGVLPS
ncbi:hypothetical protein RSSM_05046 [Rhodopirellula sallentina SM41]|uniref:Uncharacterized protein n=1 Tax=Rhodopirellula sallentina SM41 TaxID=1263870 RepID=M5TWW5_9BACT|nr:hypothetical protein RSSM_05046 [Rhodopirellula sallentina SM41]